MNHKRLIALGLLLAFILAIPYLFGLWSQYRLKDSARHLQHYLNYFFHEQMFTVSYEDYQRGIFSSSAKLNVKFMPLNEIPVLASFSTLSIDQAITHGPYLGRWFSNDFDQHWAVGGVVGQLSNQSNMLSKLVAELSQQAFSLPDLSYQAVLGYQSQQQKLTISKWHLSFSDLPIKFNLRQGEGALSRTEDRLHGDFSFRLSGLETLWFNAYGIKSQLNFDKQMDSLGLDWDVQVKRLDTIGEPSTGPVSIRLNIHSIPLHWLTGRVKNGHSKEVVEIEHFGLQSAFGKFTLQGKIGYGDEVRMTPVEYFLSFPEFFDITVNLPANWVETLVNEFLEVLSQENVMDVELAQREKLVDGMMKKIRSVDPDDSTDAITLRLKYQDGQLFINDEKVSFD